MKALFTRHRKLLPLALIVLLAGGLSGCGGVLVSAGTTVGSAAIQERGIKGRAKDLRVEALLLDKFLNAGLKLTTTIGIEVYEGRVLLTGSTTNTSLSDQAVKLAYQVDGVTEVINEIQVDKDGTAGAYAQDTWITAQLKSKMTFDEDILSINYVIETVNGTIYLIGIAQNQEELDKVIAHANSVDHVKRVVSHVRLKKKAFEEKT
ncbi:MAG: BON domain-containing protein [Rhodospirillaceae bacterium]